MMHPRCINVKEYNIFSVDIRLVDLGLDVSKNKAAHGILKNNNKFFTSWHTKFFSMPCAALVKVDVSK